MSPQPTSPDEAREQFSRGVLDRRPLIERADEVYHRLASGAVSRNAAVAEILSAWGGGLTRLGAEDLLDGDVPPSVRRFS